MLIFIWLEGIDEILIGCNVNHWDLYKSTADIYIKCIEISVVTLYLPIQFSSEDALELYKIYSRLVNVKLLNSILECNPNFLRNMIDCWPRRSVSNCASFLYFSQTIKYIFW